MGSPKDILVVQVVVTVVGGEEGAKETKEEGTLEWMDGEGRKSRRRTRRRTTVLLTGGTYHATELPKCSL